MDGLTKFIELIIQRTKTPSTKIPWETLENAYVQSQAPTSVGGGGGTGGGGGQKTNEYDYVTKWEEMELTKYAGLFSALASMSKSEQAQLGIVLELEDSWDLENFDAMAGLHRNFPLWKKGITKEIVEKEINFLMSSYPSSTSSFELIQNRIEDLLLEGNSFDRDFEKLSSVLYVVQELEQCNTTNAITLKTMTNDEEAAFMNCVEQKTKSKQNIENTVRGFAEYKFRHIPKKDIKGVAKSELQIHALDVDVLAIDTHKLSRMEVQTEDRLKNYLITNDIFWNDAFLCEELKYWLSIFKQSVPIFPGLMTVIEKIGESADNYDILQTPLTNYFNKSNLRDVDIEKLRILMLQFPGDYSDLGKSDINYEIEAYKKLAQFKITETVELEDIKNGNLIMAKKYPFFTASRFIIESNSKLKPKEPKDPKLATSELNLKKLYENKKVTDNIQIRLIVLRDIYFVVNENFKQSKAKAYDALWNPYFRTWYAYLIKTGLQDDLDYKSFETFNETISSDSQDISECNKFFIDKGCGTAKSKLDLLQDYQKYIAIFKIKPKHFTNCDQFINLFTDFKNDVHSFTTTQDIQTHSIVWRRMQTYKLKFHDTDVTNEIACVVTKLKLDMNKLMSETDPKGNLFQFSKSEGDATEKLKNQIYEIDLAEKSDKEILEKIKQIQRLSDQEIETTNLTLSVCIEALCEMYNISTMYYKRISTNKKEHDQISTFLVHMYNYFCEIAKSNKTVQTLENIKRASVKNMSFDSMEKCIGKDSDECKQSFFALEIRTKEFKNSKKWSPIQIQKYTDSDKVNIDRLNFHNTNFGSVDSKDVNLKDSIEALIGLSLSNVEDIKAEIKSFLLLKCNDFASVLAKSDKSKAVQLLKSAQRLKNN